MFYLRVLWAQFRVMPGKFLFVLILPLLLATLLKMLPVIAGKIGDSFLGARPVSYVNLICSDEGLANFLQTKLRALPLIDKVEQYAIAGLENSISKTLNDLDVNSFDHDGMKAMVGLKILFDQRVNEKEFELIKNHLNRLTTSVGTQATNASIGKEIIWGPFVRAQRIQSYTDYLDLALFGVSFIVIYLLWLVNFFPVKGILLNSIYLIERYQRRSGTYLKMTIIFMSFNILIGLQLLSKKMLINDFANLRSELLPVLFYCAFILCTTLATLDLKRFWKKA